MNKKILLLLMCLITFGFANDNNEAHITFGDAWEDGKRKNISLSKICPYLITEQDNNTKDNNTSAAEYCRVEDFSFDDSLIFFQTHLSDKNKDAEIVSNAVVRNTSGGMSQKINMYELLDDNLTCNDKVGSGDVGDDDKIDLTNCKKEKNLENLINIINGNRSIEKSNDKIINGVYPLKVEKINFLAYNAKKKSATDEKIESVREATPNKYAPILGFIRLKKIFDDKGEKPKYSNNEIAKILGTIDDQSSILSYKSDDENKNLDFYTIGKTINQWLGDEFTGNKIDFSAIKNEFKSIEVGNDNKSWSRVMSGVAVLDDSYVDKLNDDGEIVLKDNGIIKLKLDINEDLFGKVLSGVYDEIANKTEDGTKIFDKISDKKLWGFYLYLSKNLHELEILLILGLAGGTFTFVTGWKGFNYFRQLKTEQKDPLDWKKMVMQPITYTLLVATPLVPTAITIEDDSNFTINPSIKESSIKNVGFSVDNEKPYGAKRETNKLYQTPLQSIIQGAVSFGAEMADHFSRATTFSFATFLGFREKLDEDHSDFVNGLASEYATLSKQLIELSVIQRMYLSTCRLDYSFAKDGSDLKKKYAHIYPTPTNSYTQNDAQQFETRYKEMLRLKKDEFYFSVSACQKIENWLHYNSRSTIKDLVEFHQRFKGHYDSFQKTCREWKGGKENTEKECKSGFIKNNQQEDLLLKIRKLAFYEKTFGWVNVAMLPLLYQTMYPSFNPYYYKEKTQEVNKKTEISTSNFSDHYVLIGAPTTFQNFSEFSLKETNEANELDTNNGGYRDMLENYLVSTISYSLMPGYNEIETKLRHTYNMMICNDWDMTANTCGDRYNKQKGQEAKSNIENKKAVAEILKFVEMLSDKALRKSGSIEFGKEISQSSLENVIKKGTNNVATKIKNKDFATKVEEILRNNDKLIKVFLQEAVIKTTAQSLYIYMLNIVIMLVLTMILVFKIGMYFVQAIVFYVASPLIIVWAMIAKKEDQIKNYVGKSLILIFTPILIVLSGAILILAVGVIHQMYFIIVNHIMSIQIPEVYLSDAESFFAQVSTYIQMQAFFGIGNIAIGFAYLFLGYIILIKFSQWFFETVGIQTQSSMTQNIEGLTNRMGFSRSLGM